MKVLINSSAFSSGEDREAIEENMLGYKKILGDRVHIVEGGFTDVSISVEYM